MDTKITARLGASDPGAPTSPPATPIAGRVELPPATQDQAVQRLVIERDQGSGSYVYKTVDRVTGEVIQQLPRAEVLRMREVAHYAAGAVIQTKA
jgi:flagellar protein FlaG